MLKNLYVLRHGEAEHLIGEGLSGGWTDSELTTLGRIQGESVGKRISNVLKGFDFDFYCSDLSRARETAEIIGRFVHKNPIPAKDLREQNNGDAANLSLIEAKKIAIPVSEPIMDWVHYPNAESWRSFNHRVFNFMNMIQHNSKENVMIVTHRRTVVSIIQWWLELSEEYIQKVSFDVEPCSITYLRVNKYGERTISRLNDTSHLMDRDMGTGCLSHLVIQL